MNTATEPRTTKYSVPGSSFDLLDWWDNFWQDESDSVLNHMEFRDLLTLAVYDDHLTHKHNVEGTDYKAVSETCKRVGGLMQIIRYRTLAIDFPCTEGVCAFIHQLSNGKPGQAIMFLTALAVTWEQNGGFGQAIPNVAWLLEMWNHGFIAGKADTMNGPEFIHSPEWGIPGPAHLESMWRKQKAHGDEAMKFGNYLDHIDVKVETGAG
jgi:hypothetical protein